MLWTVHIFIPFLSWVVAGLRVAALIRLEVEDMALDHTGIPLNFDFPALLAYESGLIPVLGEKQPHFPRRGCRRKQGRRMENSIIQRVLS